MQKLFCNAGNYFKWRVTVLNAYQSEMMRKILELSKFRKQTKKYINYDLPLITLRDPPPEKCPI